MVNDYSANLSRLKNLVPPIPDHESVLKQAVKVCLRASLTEFEYKAGRHAARGKKKKESILDRITEFASATEADWKVECHPKLVEAFDKILSAAGS